MFGDEPAIRGEKQAGTIESVTGPLHHSDDNVQFELGGPTCQQLGLDAGTDDGSLPIAQKEFASLRRPIAHGSPKGKRFGIAPEESLRKNDQAGAVRTRCATPALDAEKGGLGVEQDRAGLGDGNFHRDSTNLSPPNQKTPATRSPALVGNGPAPLICHGGTSSPGAKRRLESRRCRSGGHATTQYP
jgi:hypothetical protein